MNPIGTVDFISMGTEILDRAIEEIVSSRIEVSKQSFSELKLVGKAKIIKSALAIDSIKLWAVFRLSLLFSKKLSISSS